MPKHKKYTLQLHLQNPAHKPLAGRTIIPVIPQDERLGEMITNKRGTARLSFLSDNFDEQYRSRGVVMIFYVYEGKRLIGTLKEELHFKESGGYQIKLELVLDVEARVPESYEFELSVQSPQKTSLIRSTGPTLAGSGEKG